MKADKFKNILERKIKELEETVKMERDLKVYLTSEIMYLQRTNEELKRENHDLKMHA